jgi:hypothetical protein
MGPGNCRNSTPGDAARRGFRLLMHRRDR